MDAKLEARRSNSEAKCANCGWWQGGEATSGKCSRHQRDTLDLDVCTGWRDGDPLQEVLAPEKN